MHKINFHQFTSIGDRAENQDYMLNKIGKDCSLFIVADGLGGHVAGEMAARFFCHSFANLADEYCHLIPRAPEKVILRWFNAAVYLMEDMFENNPEALNAYTTCAILIITEDYVISAHCGDSRIYRIKEGEIIWRTKDHSIPQQLLDQGELTEYKMGTHPEQNRLTKSICVANKFSPDIRVDLPAQIGETFMICSDGFWEFTKEHEFISLAKSDVQKVHLLKQAKMASFRANGKGDNMTLQWLRIER